MLRSALAELGPAAAPLHVHRCALMYMCVMHMTTRRATVRPAVVGKVFNATAISLVLYKP